MIRIITKGDFYVEGTANGRIFQMNKVEDGWILAFDIRSRGLFSTYELAYAEMLRLVRSLD